MTRVKRLINKHMKLCARAEKLQEKVEHAILLERGIAEVSEEAIIETVTKFYELMTTEFAQYIDLDIAKEIVRRFDVRVGDD